MAIVIAVAGAGDIVAGGLCQILEQAPDLEVLYDFPHFGILPDVVLYDVGGMQDDGGEQLTRLLGEQDATVVVVGRDLRPDLATRALAQGAVAWVSLEAPASEVLSTIRSAALGDLHPGEQDAPGLGDEANLSEREVQVLGHIVEGLSNHEIADRRSLSPNTVKTYIRATYREIEVTTRAQAVSWGLQHGFDPEGEDTPSQGKPGG